MKKELNMTAVANIYTDAYKMIQSHYIILNNMNYSSEDMKDLIQSFESDYSIRKEKIYDVLDREDANNLIDMLELKADEYYNKFARIYSLKTSKDYLD